jgi:hypothetical protein
MQKPTPLNHLECISQAKYAGAHWSLVTHSTLEAVLRPDWFLRFADYPLRVGDRIHATANMGGDLEFATFVVTVVAEKGKLVTVAQLKGGTL